MLRPAGLTRLMTLNENTLKPNGMAKKFRLPTCTPTNPRFLWLQGLIDCSLLVNLVVRKSLLIIMVLFWVNTRAQDTAFIHQMAMEMLWPQANVSVGFSANDFLAEPEKRDSLPARTWETVQQYTDSLASGTDNARWNTELAKLLNRMNRPTRSGQHFDEAYRLYTEQLESDPRNTDLLNDLVMACFERRDFESGIKYGRQVIEINPQDSNMISMLTWLYIFQGEYRKAMSYADKSINLYPDWGGGYYADFMARASLEMYGGAMEKVDSVSSYDYELAIDYSKIDAAMQQLPGNTELEATRLCMEIIQTFYESALPLFWGDVSSFGELSFITRKDHLKEIKDYEKRLTALERNPDFNNLYTIEFCRGALYLLSNREEEAIDRFITAISLKGPEYVNNLDNHASAYDNISTCYFMLNDTVNAQKWIRNKCYDTLGSDPQGYYYTELAAFRMYYKDFDEAKELYNRALEIDSSTAIAYVGLANIAILQGDYVLAETLQQQCYAINPNQMEMYYSSILQRLCQKEKLMARWLVDEILDFDPEDWFANEVLEHIWPEGF